MAVITISDALAFDLDKLDLSNLLDGDRYEVSSTIFRVSYDDGFADDFRGSGFRYDDDGFPIGGTVTSYFQYGRGITLGRIEDVKIAATDLVDAARTSSTSDDLLVFIKALGGKDIFNGGARRDRLESYNGNDKLYGFGGDDTLDGGAKDDLLAGGVGRDALIGGRGEDDFLFDAELGKKNIDDIADFNAKQDTILLDRDIFDDAGRIGRLDRDAFHSGSKAQDASDRIIYNAISGKLFYDADGDGVGKAVVFARLDDGLTLTFKDFEIV